MLNDFLYLLFQVLIVLNYLFVFIIIFYERKSAAVTWAWLMVLLIVPYFGFLIFMMLGLDSRKHRVFLEKAKLDTSLYRSLLFTDDNGFTGLIRQTNYKNSNPVLDLADSVYLNDMIYLNYVSGGSILTKNNRAKLFHNGSDKFQALLEDIRAAKYYVHLQYYIFRSDELGREIINALAEKAREGVEVRVSVDGMGNFANRKSFYKPLMDAGGEVAVFLPPRFIRMNFRNHRKLVIIDGLTGYIGGFNIGNEYLGKVKRYGNWRDTHIKIEGDAVKELQLRFIADWAFMKKERLPLNEYYLPPISEKFGSVNMQIVSSGPDTTWSSIQYGYTKMISEANRNIYITTPYFVPDDSIFESLRIAALSGIDVRVIIPANPDHLFVYGASLSYLGELLDAGVKCYKYEDGFVHSKLLTIDGIVCSVGTANMDLRSFKLNFEINSFIYDAVVTEELEREFLRDLMSCTQIDAQAYKNRSNVLKIREAIGRLLSPLL